MKTPTRLVTVDVSLTIAPQPVDPLPDFPVPDTMPTIWRVTAENEDGSWFWVYLRRGLQDAWTEFALCEQHKVCLKAIPPDEAEIEHIRHLAHVSTQ